MGRFLWGGIRLYAAMVVPSNVKWIDFMWGKLAFIRQSSGPLPGEETTNVTLVPGPVGTLHSYKPSKIVLRVENHRQRLSGTIIIRVEDHRSACPERSSFASKIIVQSVRMIIVRAKYHCSVCPENHRSRRRLLFSLSGRSVFASKIIIQSVRKIIVRVEYHHSVCPEYHRSRRISLFSLSGRASFLLLTLV